MGSDRKCWSLTLATEVGRGGAQGFALAPPRLFLIFHMCLFLRPLVIFAMGY